jgi:hypothetical protein
MTIALDTKLANQLYKKQLALEGKTVKAFEDEILQEALGKLFDRTSNEYKLFKTVILDYYKQEKVNKRLTDQLQNTSQTCSARRAIIRIRNSFDKRINHSKERGETTWKKRLF